MIRLEFFDLSYWIQSTLAHIFSSDSEHQQKICHADLQVNYDTVYASRENQEKATNNAQKIRQLQQNELQCTMDQVIWPRKNW